MKRLFFSCCFLCLLCKTWGQVSTRPAGPGLVISGRLATAGRQPIPFANVLLLKVADSSLVRAALSTENGSYKIGSIEPGRYYLRVSSVGYQLWNSPVFELTAAQPGKDFGLTVIQTDTSQLGAVIVRAEKPLFQQQINGTVVNVENSILTKGSSVLEVLERSPGVVIDRRSNAISLNGKNGVLVLLNGRQLRMSMDQLVNLLNSMPADNIEKIELLTSPPANYDADGNAGIINIVLKKNRKQGTNGSLSIAGGYGYREKGSASLNLGHNSRNIDVYGSYAFSHDRSAMDWHAKSTQDFPLLGGATYADFLSVIKPTSNSHNATGGIDLRLDPKTTIGGSISYNNSREDIITHNLGTFIVLPDSPLFLDATINEINHWKNWMVSLYAEKKIRDGERINFDLDLLDYKNSDPTDALSSFSNAKGVQAGTNDTLSSPQQKGYSDTRVRVGVGKFDYTKRLSQQLKLETGIKGTYTNTASVSSIASLVGGAWVRRSGTSNNMVMKEGIGAAYASLTAELSPSTSLVAGIRYEYSDTRMVDPEKQQLITERKLSKLFPSVFLSKKTGERSGLHLSYTTRISRPSYNDLASYVIYTGPTSIETGNPLLKPTITNNLKLGYVYRGYSFSVQLSRDDHPIVRYQITSSADGVLMVLSPENLVYQNSLLLQTSLPVKVNDWWTMSYTITGGWRRYREDFTPVSAEKSWFGYSGNFSESFRLPRSFSLEVSGWYNSRVYDGSKKTDGFGALNAGIKKELRNNGGSLQLYMTDILRTTTIVNYYGTLTKEAFSLKSRVPFRPESSRSSVIRISYSRSIGGGSQSRRGAGSQEERDRIRE